jgi:hypothetical protein
MKTGFDGVKKYLLTLVPMRGRPGSVGWDRELSSANPIIYARAVSSSTPNYFGPYAFGSAPVGF